MKSKLANPFDSQIYLESVGVSKWVAEFLKKATHSFLMGEPADSATYILKRNAKLMVVNEGGKEAVVALFAPVTFWEKGA